MKQWIRAAAFWIVCVCVTVGLYVVTRWVAEMDKLAKLALELTTGYQVKQIMVSVLLYVAGYLLIISLNIPIQKGWTIFLAYPAGLVSWCILSYFVTLLGIPYNSMTMLIITIVFLAGIMVRAAFICRKDDWKDFAQTILYFSGVSALVSSGVLTILLSFDSSYFIMKYGELLVLNGGFGESVKTWMQWTGLMPAYFSSLAYMSGFENIFTIHHMLIISFAGFFFFSILEQIQKCSFSKRKTWCFATAVTMFLLLTAPFHLMAQFVISNTYVMIYMYLLVVLSYKITELPVNARKGMVILLGMITVMLTLCRAETCTVVCFLIVCISTLQIGNKELYWAMLIPAGFAQITYWIKMIWVTGIPDSDQMGIKTVIVMGGVYLGTVIYVIFIRKAVKSLFKEKLPTVMMLGLAAAGVVLLIVKRSRAVINLDAEFYNIANEFWGPFPWIALLICIILIYYVKRFETGDLIWLGYIVFNFAICMCRFNDLRKGFGDSYNRILCGIVPLFLWVMTRHYAERCNAEKL